MKNVGSDALTLAPGDPGGPRGPIGPCQSKRGKVRWCTTAIGSEMIVYVCVAYHGSRHRHGRRFVVVAMGHLRGEVLEEGKKEKNKILDASDVWHRDWKSLEFKLFHDVDKMILIPVILYVRECFLTYIHSHQSLWPFIPIYEYAVSYTVYKQSLSCLKFWTLGFKPKQAQAKHAPISKRA